MHVPEAKVIILLILRYHRPLAYSGNQGLRVELAASGWREAESKASGWREKAESAGELVKKAEPAGEWADCRSQARQNELAGPMGRNDEQERRAGTTSRNDGQE